MGQFPEQREVGTSHGRNHHLQGEAGGSRQAWDPHGRKKNTEAQLRKNVAQEERSPTVSGSGQLAQYLLAGLACVQQVAQETDAGLKEPPGSQVMGTADEKGTRASSWTFPRDAMPLFRTGAEEEGV